MDPEIGNQLRHSYPAIFINFQFADPAVHPDPDLLVGDGWYFLLDSLCRELQWETDENDAPQVRATQVTEKTGRLRFCVAHASETQHGMIRLFENLSERCCETCGAPAVEISVTRHQPRCQLHYMIELVPFEDMRSISLVDRLVFWAVGMWNRGRLGTTEGKKFDAVAALNEAIRAGDVHAVQRSLDAGATVNSCSCDQDGYHTPLELAREYGSASVIRAIERNT